VAADKRETQNLRDLRGRIDKAITQLGQPAKAAPVPLNPGTVELFAGCYLLPDSSVALRREDGKWQYTRDAKTWRGDGESAKPTPCPPTLVKLLLGVMGKLAKEFVADVSVNEAYLRELAQDRIALDKDLREYASLANSFGTSYEVDYGTDTMSAQSAIDMTQRDISANENEIAKTNLEQEKLKRDAETLKNFRF
jgi:hypothetical protein